MTTSDNKVPQSKPLKERLREAAAATEAKIKALQALARKTETWTRSRLKTRSRKL